jgi:hypothetical protein
MENKHWGDDEFIASLYGVGRQDGHLECCPACRDRWVEFQSRREALRQDGRTIPEGFWAAQRRAIRARLPEEGHRLLFGLAPVLSAALLVLAVLTVLKPVPDVQRPETTPDEQVFEQVFTTASGTEPVAIDPIQNLFEVQQ